MAHAHGGSHSGVRLHRVFLQSTAAPLGAPLSQSSTVREENPQPDHRGLTVTCPRKRGNSMVKRAAGYNNGLDFCGGVSTDHPKTAVWINSPLRRHAARLTVP